MSFEFPNIHAFPPLYTKQPNTTVLNNQLDSWCKIILDYCQFYRITSLSAGGEPQHSQIDNLDTGELPPLFANKDIERSVGPEFMSTIFQHLIHVTKRAEYVDPKRPDLGLLVYWRTLPEWAAKIYDYVSSTGQLGTVLTVFELTNLEGSGFPEELRNLEYNVLERAIKTVLMKQGKAQILMAEDGTLIGGVKIV